MTRILLVEDDANILLLLEHVLSAAGYQVDTAATVRSACVWLARRSYDLVVADGKLSDGTGMMVADRAAERGAKALIVSAYAFLLPGEELFRYPYLMKPVRPSEFLRAVERALDQSTAPSPDQVRAGTRSRHLTI